MTFDHLLSHAFSQNLCKKWTNTTLASEGRTWVSYTWALELRFRHLVYIGHGLCLKYIGVHRHMNKVFWNFEEIFFEIGVNGKPYFCKSVTTLERHLLFCTWISVSQKVYVNSCGILEGISWKLFCQLPLVWHFYFIRPFQSQCEVQEHRWTLINIQNPLSYSENSEKWSLTLWQKEHIIICTQWSQWKDWSASNPLAKPARVL